MTGAGDSSAAVSLATPGAVRVTHPVHRDERGWFAKPFDAPRFAARGLAPDWVECFASLSRRGVVRGFHLQLPPAQHDKLVWVAFGAAVSVLLDLRRGSPAYGVPEMVEHDRGHGDALFVPRGVAHAFQALTDDTLLVYLVTSAHDGARDAGVRWDSVGVRWPVAPGPVSARDRALPTLAAFDSPFQYDG
jgi:dTDP-4-dehydrorhamnose 3,5-epimerase